MCRQTNLWKESCAKSYWCFKLGFASRVHLQIECRWAVFVGFVFLLTEADTLLCPIATFMNHQGVGFQIGNKICGVREFYQAFCQTTVCLRSSSRQIGFNSKVFSVPCTLANEGGKLTDNTMHTMNVCVCKDFVRRSRSVLAS